MNPNMRVRSPLATPIWSVMRLERNAAVYGVKRVRFPYRPLMPRQLGRYKRPPEERKKVVRFDPGALMDV